MAYGILLACLQIYRLETLEDLGWRIVESTKLKIQSAYRLQSRKKIYRPEIKVCVSLSVKDDPANSSACPPHIQSTRA